MAERDSERGLRSEDVKVGDWLWVPGANGTRKVTRLPSRAHGGWDIGGDTFYVSDSIWRRFVRVEPPRPLAEHERLRAVVQAEIDMHFKRQDMDSDGVEAGLPYCDVDDFVWPCPVRRRLEGALGE